MNEPTLVKLSAIVSLTVLELVNLMTAKIDGSALLTIGAIIGGIAGYELGRNKPVSTDSEKELEEKGTGTGEGEKKAGG